MKKIVILAFLATFIITSCDKIEGPYISVDESTETNVEFPELDPTAVTRNVFIEEFTGHKCPNCPEGQAILSTLHELYGEQLVSISIHQGMFAITNSFFPEDFRTDEGNELATYFTIGQYPSGVVNRKKFNGQYGLGRAEWQQNIEQELEVAPIAAVQLINVYDAGSKKLTAHSKTTFLQDYDGKVQMAFYVIEDGIIAPQIYHSDTIQDYEHNHVLRCSINGTFGTYISNDGTVVAGEGYLKSYELDLNGREWNVANCSIVAILMDAESKEVLQVEKCHFF